ncbi:MAG: AAA family ATPase [Desulfosudis oleivorans]|nr:AAA family ATPase [Desulfosudis oleivorans]
MKTLEIFGFKSFADKVQIEFSDGVAALLGPNGCGKSNVVDAIKWVVGEQSARSLRAGEHGGHHLQRHARPARPSTSPR